MNLQYRLGYLAGRWQQLRKRLNLQYLRGYLAGRLKW
jgi:hypothetical protein